MKYISTRGQVEPIEFQQAVLMGLADDGGLIIPESIPDVTSRLDDWRELTYQQLALEVVRLFATDIAEDDLRKLIDRTYGEAFVGGVAPVVPVGDLFVQELWHGPTLAFKDIALQFLGNLFEYILAREGGRLNILGATSGDTGSAAIHGVRGRAGISIFVMHPAGRVSEIQQRQMTTVLDENVHNIAIAGSFDDCQNIMKALAADLDFKRKYSIGAVNSVNWARVLAQIVYYFWGYFEVRRLGGGRGEPIRVAVPTGNFGDVLAGWYAMKMGAPISQLILATNENDILSRFFNTGEYSTAQVRHTLSPSMDIQVASNFERYLYYRLGCDAGVLCGLMDEFAATGNLRVDCAAGEAVDPAFYAAAATEEEVLATIGKYHEKFDCLLDPHTAVGVHVAEEAGPATGPILCLATAHPAKFPDAIEQATGDKNIATHPAIEAIMKKPTRCETLPNDKEAVRRFIIKAIE
jgi:threonine synthase